MSKVLMLGTDALARGAIEAGISYAASYPGTPATQILEYVAKNSSVPCEWSINEKVAFEVAYGVSLTGRRVLCSMKHVGLNVAADPFMTSAYLGVRGGFVLAIGDDPGAYSSQNEQDSRFYARFAKIPCLEPYDGETLKEYTKIAFDISEELSLPVMIRSQTRLLHCYSPVNLGDIRHENSTSLQKDPLHLIAIPRHVIPLHRELNAKQGKIRETLKRYNFNEILPGEGKRGIIACGLAFTYAMELGEALPILKINAYPVDEDLLRDFVKDLEEVIVLEEGYPLVEERVRCLHPRVRGKISGDLPLEGELGPDPVLKLFGKKREVQPETTPPRPPVLCPGCPHREFYKALLEANPTFVTGDIGCYTLGALPPLSALDTCLCMGASISKAIGMAKQGVKRVAAVIGDSTFWHTGIPALIDAVWNKANILVCILDNSVVAMTGHQPTPHLGITAKGDEGKAIDLAELCRACGADSVVEVDPLKKEELLSSIKRGLETPGVHVVIAKRPCVLIAGKLKKN
ncbi:MAG: thiamine pyrophosphate-dependent enzyme [Caldimicrobium sp.]|nr:thiamine pyrophosphate-dependent enzyme [Caldimicrobium sp.]MDW8183537.1 thiamine pyrophosphate-dependent enzyme [Caldimicrobium sp.]